jgi:hypothetical protein
MFAVVVALIGATVAFAAHPPPPSQSHKTYGELSNAWWQWVLSIPTSTNPLLGNYSDGNPKCSAGQSGSVWFLAGVLGGGKAHRSCTIPAGKTLFFPTFNSFQNNVGVKGNPACPPTHFSIPHMWKILDQNIAAVTSQEATVDGIAQQAQRAGPNNSPYSVTVPTDNLFNLLCASPPNPPIPAGTYYPNVSDGFYVLHAPLSPGKHTIHFSAAAPSLNTSLDVTYYLTVK